MTTTIPGPQVTVNPDGSWTLPVLLRFQNPLDIANTGVGTITVLPSSVGGDIASAVAQFVPLLGYGPPGLTPNFAAAVNLIELAPGETPPSGTPYAQFAMTDPGNDVTAPTWQLTLYVHRGADGSFAMPNVEGLANISGTLADGKTLYYNATTSKWVISDPKTPQFVACTAYLPATGATAPTVPIGMLTFGARGYARQIAPQARIIVNPATDGTTTIKLLARLGSTTGAVIGESLGLAHSAPFEAILTPNKAAADVANQVASGASVNVYLMAALVSSSSSAWSTSITDAAFTATAFAA